ncbi:hypothetical protein [Streptomyces tropicalis]|uniref:Uncharacterized protein n=1 Tax=Streptomyces tropicalis TaxID=3034234 RepID=A0ABT6A8M2_9ACTN|nr:hypothetical protein [Streptomyces tropicalis]MDF3301000.1 hypothetical protein [Streptomyces tropicalis]
MTPRPRTAVLHTTGLLIALGAAALPCGTALARDHGTAARPTAAARAPAHPIPPAPFAWPPRPGYRPDEGSRRPGPHADPEAKSDDGVWPHGEGRRAGPWDERGDRGGDDAPGRGSHQDGREDGGGTRGPGDPEAPKDTAAPASTEAAAPPSASAPSPTAQRPLAQGDPARVSGPVLRILPLGSGLILIGLGLGIAFLGLRVRQS